MITLTGAPVNANSEPALAANANGIKNADGARLIRRATITATGKQRRDRAVSRDQCGHHRGQSEHQHHQQPRPGTRLGATSPGQPTW